MAKTFALTILLASAAASPAPSLRSRKLGPGTTLIPETVFTSQSEFETFFDYNYPWGETHNGAALMQKSQVSIIDNSYLQLQSNHTGSQPDNSGLSYISGTVHAKQQFTVAPGGGLDFQANFVAPVAEGCWPAFWLTAVHGWPPEIDLAEWKGTGKILFNTFNTSAEVASTNVDYPKPTMAWHTIKVELRAQDDGKTVKANFYMNGKLITTQYGKDYVGAGFWLIIDYQMLGSSGGTGPTHTTNFNVQSLSVVSYNPVTGHV